MKTLYRVLFSLFALMLLVEISNVQAADMLGLWNGTAHFSQDKIYNSEMANGHKEGFAISRTDYLVNGASTAFLYYRCYEYGVPRICLGIYDYTAKNLLQNKGPVITPTLGYFSVAPSVAKVNGVWTMVYEEGGSTEGTYWATSSDGINWTKQGALFHDGIYRATPGLFVDGNTIYVFYAQKVASDKLAIIFHSGSSMSNLVQWGGGYVLQGAQGWSAASVSMPRIIRQGGYYWMFYEGASTNLDCGDTNNNLYGWGVARSTDLVHWDQFSGNPIMRKDATTNSQSCGNDMPQPFLNAINNTVSVFHTSNDTLYLVKDLLIDGNACAANQTFPNYRQINGRCTMSCGAMGGNACYNTKTCPSGSRIGMSYDCGSCCKQ